MQYSKPFALLLLDLIDAAYALSLGQPYTLPSGFSPAAPIRLAPGAVPELLEHDALSVWGLSTEFAGQQYIAFRGTKNAAEWLADLIALPLRPHSHFGFHAIYQAVRASVDVTPDAIIAGHSLGGAIASLCFANGGGQLMTFGGPRVGDARFSRTLAGTVRVVNDYDIVPQLPPPPIFQHGGTLVQVNGPGSLWNAPLAHHVTSYRAGILAGE